MYKNKKEEVTILILIDGFLQLEMMVYKQVIVNKVTILILIDGFLQSESHPWGIFRDGGHNPYFNRWFSAI